MEYRKLIAFGKSSYVISLPKAWIRQQKMKKGDLIYLEERENSLLLSSKIQGSPEPKKITISVDNKKIPQIRREVNAAYIENYREIALVGKQLKQQSAELLDMARSLIALEVLEITTEKIVTKDFLDMDKVSIKELIKKAKCYKAKLVFLGLPPVDEARTLPYEETSFTNKRVKKFNDVVKESCEAAEVSFLDIFESFS